jgi:hypothetical protein
MKAIAPPVIGFGFCLLLASVLWPLLFPATRSWTDEKSRRLKELSSKAQMAMAKVEWAERKPNMTGGENPAVLKEQAAEMMAELSALQTEFTSAVDGPQTMSAILKWSGVGAMALGIVGYLATKDA